MEHEAATWLYRWEVTSSQHYTTWWGCEEISIGKSQKGTNSFLFHFLAQSLLPPSYSSPFTWFFFCNLDCYPSTLSHSRGKKEKLDVLVWLLWFPTDDAQKQLARVPSLYARSLRITTRNYLTRITLQTPGGDWRSTGGLRVKRMMVYLRPLQVCRHLRVPSSPSHGLRSCFPNFWWLSCFSFQCWVVNLFCILSKEPIPTLLKKERKVGRDQERKW
jgi:hypothetical protein